jgi:Ca-activated chloride channel family protein
MNRVCYVALALMLAILSLQAQDRRAPDLAGPTLKIDAPMPDALLAGEQILKAVISPAGTSVASVEFLVDGAPACRAVAVPFECAYQFGERIAAHTIRAVANLSDGKWVATTVRTARGLEDTVDVIAVSVPVVVKDYLGRFVNGLKPESFRVFENDVPQVVTYVDVENVPLDVVVAIDISGSMIPSMPKLKAIVRRFVDTLAALARTKTHVNITVLAFNDRPFVISKPEDSQASRSASIDALKAYGGTSLYDAILSSIDLLGRDISRKAIIVFTDGDDRSSLSSIEPVEKRIHDSNASVYMITQGAGAQMEAVRKVVNGIAEISGGRAYSTEKIDELQRALDRIMDDLTHQYLIGYSPTNTAHDGTYRKITVRTTQNSHEIRAREGYLAPGK